MDYKSKYLKYKNKYNTLKIQSGGKKYHSERFPESLQTYIGPAPDMELSQQVIVRGLPNAGNTCFINAVILLLASIKGFYSRLIQIKDNPVFQDDREKSSNIYDDDDREELDIESILINTNLLRDLIEYIKTPENEMLYNDESFDRESRLELLRNKKGLIKRKILDLLDRNRQCDYDGSSGSVPDSLRAIINNLKLYHILKDILYFTIKQNYRCIDAEESFHSILDDEYFYQLNVPISQSELPSDIKYNLGNIINRNLNTRIIGGEARSMMRLASKPCKDATILVESEFLDTKRYLLLDINRTTEDGLTLRESTIPISGWHNLKIGTKSYSLRGVIIKVNGIGVNHFVYFYKESKSRFHLFNDDKPVETFTNLGAVANIHNTIKSLIDFISLNGVLFLYESDDSSTLGATIPVDVSRSTDSQSEIIKKIGKLEEFLKIPELNLDKGFRTMKENQLEYLKSKLGDISRSPLSQTTTTQPIAYIVSPQKLRKPNPTIINSVDPKNDIPTQIKDITDKIKRIRVIILNDDKYDPEFIINEKKTLEILEKNLLMLKEINSKPIV